LLNGRKPRHYKLRSAGYRIEHLDNGNARRRNIGVRRRDLSIDDRPELDTGRDIGGPRSGQNLAEMQIKICRLTGVELYLPENDLPVSIPYEIAVHVAKIDQSATWRWNDGYQRDIRDADPHRLPDREADRSKARLALYGCGQRRISANAARSPSCSGGCERHEHEHER
jgi:hypothetical protein